MTNTFTFLVCPHDTASHPERWYMFVQYLAQQLSTHIQFDISLDFEDFHSMMGSADLVYANPSDTFHLMQQKGLTPLVRPENIYDEVVFVASHDIANPTLESLQGARLASVTSLLPTNIALHILKNRSIEPAEVVDHESWLSVMGAIWRGEVEYGIVYKDTYDELSEQGKGMGNAFHVSNERIAFHALGFEPALAAQRQELERVLLGMHTDEKGQEVLKELHVTRWVSIAQSELDTMQHIIEAYP